MVTYIELPYLFTVTHSFFLHGFNNHLLEFTCVFLVRYPFRHIKSPHLLTVYHMSDKWVADHIRGALSVVLTGQPFLSCPVLFFDYCSKLFFGAEASVSRCLSAPNDRACRYGYAAPMLLRSTRSASSESTHLSPLKSIISSLPSVSNPSAYLIISKASYVVISPSWFTSPIIQ